MSEVQIDFDGIMRKLEANGFDEVNVEFMPDQSRNLALVDAMSRALLVANRDVPETAGQMAAVSVNGGTVLVDDYWDFDSLGAWLTVFAGALAADGYQGLVRATPTVAMPQWFTTLGEPRLAAYVAFDGEFAARDLYRPGRMAAAPVVPEVAGWCERSVEWAAASGGQGYLANVFHQPGGPDDLGGRLYLALRVSSVAAVYFAPGQPGPASGVALQADGSAVYEAYGPWPPLERAREALLVNGNQARVGVVAVTRYWQPGWMGGRSARPPLPPSALGGNNPLWSDHVPGMFGMMLLTGRHLSRVADLSRWRVTPLDGGRYLVEANDLGEWFGPDGPDEAVLAQARSDLGDAIAAPG